MEAHFAERWFQLDIARERIFHRDEWIVILDLIGELGYNGICLYLEGAVELQGIPGKIRPGVLTQADVDWLKQEATARQLKLIPMTNLVGHMEHFLSQERFQHLGMSPLPQLDFSRPDAEQFALTIADEYIRMFNTEYLHIGGDEVELDDDNKKLYAKFLAGICEQLLARGIKPCIWSDMLWMNPELIDGFPRETVIYDWNYYGHRPDSLKFWQDAGFRHIICCPCDNGWEGFINSQRVSGQLKAQMEPDVQLDEVEAFLEDAVQEGITSGLLTTWNNELGNMFWSNLTPVVRAALYMRGEWKGGAAGDEQIELAMFGRVTPYTRLTRMLQQQVQKPIIAFEHLMRPCVPRQAVYSRTQFMRVLETASVIGESLIPAFERALPAAKQAIAEWEPEGQRETLCHGAMQVTIANIDVSLALIKGGFDGYKHYQRAASLQFDDPRQCRELLLQAKEAFESVTPLNRKLLTLLTAHQQHSGHSRGDTRRLGERVDDVARIMKGIEDLARKLDAKSEISLQPLPEWNGYIRYCLTGAPIPGYLMVAAASRIHSGY